MFSPLGCRAGFPREPRPRPPRPPRPHGPQDKPPWEHHYRRGRGRWQPPHPWDPRPFPGPDGFPWKEEDRRWAPKDCPPRPPWDDREDYQGPEDSFRDGLCLEPLMPDPGNFNWSKCPKKEQHPPWPPAFMLGGRGRLDGRRCRRLRHSHRALAMVQRFRWLRPCRGNLLSPPCSQTSQSGVKEEPQHPDPPQLLISLKDGAQSKEQKSQDPPVVSEKVPESPKAASTAQKSPAADIQAATEAAEAEQAAGATPVEPGAGQKPTDEHGQSPPALGMEPAPPEESSAGTGEHPEVEPCSQSVPKAGAGDGSEPPGPTAPLEPTERVHTAAGSTGEEGAEPCHCSQEHQCLPSAAGGAEAACDGRLGGLQPSKASQVPAGAAAKPDTEPSQASSSVCTVPVTSPGTQDPPGAGETETIQSRGDSIPPRSPRDVPRSPDKDVGTQQWLCSALRMPIPAGVDLRSAIVLARKEEIELSYQQSCLTIAVVATMLLQKEPSMETALGLALRANLRQGRIHHLRELEDFINSYDSATLSR